MDLIIDANIIISALIKDSKTREILRINLFNLYSPEALLESLEKYREEFIERSGLSESQFDILLDSILDYIDIIKKEDYYSKLKEAIEIIGHIDIEDTNYIALALSIKNDGIWSDDAHFDKQNKIKIWKTKDINNLLTQTFFDE